MSIPKRPSEIPVPTWLLDRHLESCVHGVRSVYAQLTIGKGLVGRLDQFQHRKVIDVDVPEDLIARERASPEARDFEQ